MEEGAAADGTVAQSEAQARAIWRVREGISEALPRLGGRRGCVHCDARGVPAW